MQRTDVRSQRQSLAPSFCPKRRRAGPAWRRSGHCGGGRSLRTGQGTGPAPHPSHRTLWMEESQMRCKGDVATAFQLNSLSIYSPGSSQPRAIPPAATQLLPRVSSSAPRCPLAHNHGLMNLGVKKFVGFWWFFARGKGEILTVIISSVLLRGTQLCHK